MIIRTEKNGHYTTIANYALNDPKLSLKAKGLWAFIMSKPDDWDINYRGLSKQLKEGQRAILGALKELEDSGYLERGITRHENGRYFQTVATLHEQPCVRFVRVDSVRTHNSRTKVNTVELKTDKDIDTKVSMGGKPPMTSVYGKEDINELHNIWAQSMGTPIQRKAQRNRQACYRLYQKTGLEEAKQLIWSAASARGVAYAPQIRDFIELEEKLPMLHDWEIGLATPKNDTSSVRHLLHPEKYGREVAHV